MNSEKIIELIHAEIDGIITADEKNTLDSYLKTDSEMKQLYLELTGMAGIFNQTAKIEPPIDLKDSILDSIQLDKYNKTARYNILSQFWENLKLKIKPQYAISYSAGLATGLVLFLLLVYNLGYLSNIDHKDISGTIISNDSADDFAIIDELQINHPEINGEIQISKLEDKLELQITLRSEKEFKFLADFDPVQFFLQSFSYLVEGTKIMETSNGAIMILHKGENSYSIVFRNRLELESQIVFKLYSDKLIYEGKTIVNN